jgi:recombination DNA repair RAD52 pathway protein
MEDVDANEKSVFDEQNEEQDIDPLHEEFQQEEELEATLDVASLRLAPDVEAKARQLKSRAPSVQFTSGRRDLARQARAMAGNVARKRKWIEQTYRSSSAIRKLQNWVDTHPSADTVDEIANGLANVMRSLPEAQLMSIVGACL